MAPQVLRIVDLDAVRSKVAARESIAHPVSLGMECSPVVLRRLVQRTASCMLFAMFSSCHSTTISEGGKGTHVDGSGNEPRDTGLSPFPASATFALWFSLSILRSKDRLHLLKVHYRLRSIPNNQGLQLLWVDRKVWRSSDADMPLR